MVTCAPPKIPNHMYILGNGAPGGAKGIDPTFERLIGSSKQSARVMRTVPADAPSIWGVMSRSQGGGPGVHRNQPSLCGFHFLQDCQELEQKE